MRLITGNESHSQREERLASQRARQSEPGLKKTIKQDSHSTSDRFSHAKF